MSKTILRVEKNKDNPFVMIDRRPIENPTLSWRAKGVLAYLLSRPDNWIVRLGDLVKRSPDGVYAVRGAIKELKMAGHITRQVEREGGRIKQYVILVHEMPTSNLPTNLQQAEIPHAGNLTHNNNDSVNKNKDKDIALPQSKNQEVKDKANKEVDYILKISLSPKAIQDAVAKFFLLTPNWEGNKFNRQWMAWAMQNDVTPAQIEYAANLWKSDKRFNWQQPGLKGIQEHWLELRGKPSTQPKLDANDSPMSY